jgi:hypothetical protein
MNIRSGWLLSLLITLAVPLAHAAGGPSAAEAIARGDAFQKQSDFAAAVIRGARRDSARSGPELIAATNRGQSGDVKLGAVRASSNLAVASDAPHLPSAVGIIVVGGPPTGLRKKEPLSIDLI